MSIWKEYRLGDVLTFQRGYDLPKSDMIDGIYPVAGSNGIIGYHDKYTTNGPGVTIGRSGNVGNSKFYPGNFWAHNTVLFVKDFKKSHPKFIYYFLKTIDFSQFNAGSAVPTLNRNHIHELLVKIPSFERQVEIAEILSSLDDKIDLLNRQTIILESLVSVLFRNLFQNKSNDFKKVRLGEYVEIKRGGSPRPINDFLTNIGYRWLKISDVTSSISPYVTETKEYIIEKGLSKTVYLKKGSLVLSNSATPGIPKILDVDTCIHDGWLYFPESMLSNEFLYLLFKFIRPQLLSLGNGSIFTNLKTDILRQYEMDLPKLEVLRNFEEKLAPYFLKMHFNTIQTLKLKKLQNILLKSFFYYR